MPPFAWVWTSPPQQQRTSDQRARPSAVCCRRGSRRAQHLWGSLPTLSPACAARHNYKADSVTRQEQYQYCRAAESEICRNDACSNPKRLQGLRLVVVCVRQRMERIHYIYKARIFIGQQPGACILYKSGACILVEVECTRLSRHACIVECSRTPSLCHASRSARVCFSQSLR